MRYIVLTHPTQSLFLDFLVFHKGKRAIFQVDGAGHKDNQDWDDGVDRGCGFWRRWAVND
ncbi:MAG: hypothetical protein ACK5CA_06695 [Cyanobacteriota bacterium]